MPDHRPTIDRLDVRAYRIPTDAPESDGTLAGDATGMVVVHAHGGGETGLGYTYAPPRATAAMIEDKLEGVVVGRDIFATAGTWEAMAASVRNAGRAGVCSEAIAAVDIALWDLKARVLGVSMVDLLGRCRDAVAIYGSGGFTSYSQEQLTDQLSGWVDQGIPRVKMKVGRQPEQDPARVCAARRAIGDEAELFVDANAAYGPGQAIDMGCRFADQANVTWYEEPRPSDDLAGLRRVRDQTPAGIEIATGEYGYLLSDFRQWLDGEVADCLQADVTRCGGITGLLNVAALCEAARVPLSAHCAPALAAHPCCCLRPLRHIEYFHDHVRIEQMLLDGTLDPIGGSLEPDRGRPGLGLTFKTRDAERYAV